MPIQYRSGIEYRNPINYQGSNGSFMSMRARIKGVPQTLSIQARILAPYTLSLRARISRRQGWPILDPSDPGFTTWQDTRLSFKSRILHFIAFPTQTMRMKGRITYGKTLSLQSKARIVTAGFMSMRAHILPRFFTVSARMSFDVRRTSQTRLRVVFYMQGAAPSWSLSMKARIVKTHTSRMTGHFVVAMPVVFNTVLSVENPTTLSGTRQTLTVRARIVK